MRESYERILIDQMQVGAALGEKVIMVSVKAYKNKELIIC